MLVMEVYKKFKRASRNHAIKETGQNQKQRKLKQISDQENVRLTECAEAPQLHPIKYFSPDEIYYEIRKHISVKKVSGIDLITDKILKKLFKKAIMLLIVIYNAMLRIDYLLENSTDHTNSQVRETTRGSNLL